MKKQKSTFPKGNGKEIRKIDFSKSILSLEAQAKIKGGGLPWLDLPSQ